MPSNDGTDYAAPVDKKLAIAASAADHDAKVRHLNRAAHLVTLHERSRAPHLAPRHRSFAHRKRQRRAALPSRLSRMGCWKRLGASTAMTLCVEQLRAKSSDTDRARTVKQACTT
jgi:hypothetical protein